MLTLLSNGSGVGKDIPGICSAADAPTTEIMMTPFLLFLEGNAWRVSTGESPSKLLAPLLSFMISKPFMIALMKSALGSGPTLTVRMPTSSVDELERKSRRDRSWIFYTHGLTETFMAELFTWRVSPERPLIGLDGETDATLSGINSSGMDTTSIALMNATEPFDGMKLLKRMLNCGLEEGRNKGGPNAGLLAQYQTRKGAEELEVAATRFPSLSIETEDRTESGT
nr:hypothetical protein Iba_chr03cCG11990 [Ipomoea batatas]